MSDYTGDHRSARNGGRWVTLVVYGVALAGIAASLAGWWH